MPGTIFGQFLSFKVLDERVLDPNEHRQHFCEWLRGKGIRANHRNGIFMGVAVIVARLYGGDWTVDE